MRTQEELDLRLALDVVHLFRTSGAVVSGLSQEEQEVYDKALKVVLSNLKEQE